MSVSHTVTLLAVLLFVAVLSVSAMRVEEIPGLLHFNKNGGNKHARDFHYHNPDTGEYYKLKYNLETTGETFVNPRPEDGVNGLICHKVKRNDVLVSFNTSEYASKWFAEAKAAHILTTMHPVECHDGPVLIRITTVEMFGPRFVRVLGKRIRNVFEFLKHFELQASTNMKSVRTKMEKTDISHRWMNETRGDMRALAEAAQLPNEYYKDPELYRRRQFEETADANERSHVATLEKDRISELQQHKIEIEYEEDEEMRKYRLEMEKTGGKALSEEEQHSRAMKALGDWHLECGRKLFGRCIWYSGVFVQDEVVQGPFTINENIGPSQAVQERITAFISSSLTGGTYNAPKPQAPQEVPADAAERAEEEKSGIYNLDKFFESVDNYDKLKEAEAAKKAYENSPGATKTSSGVSNPVSVSVAITTAMSYITNYRAWETMHLAVTYSGGATQSVKVWKETEWLKKSQFHLALTGSISITKSWTLYSYSYNLGVIGIAGLFGLAFVLKFEVTFAITFTVSAKFDYTKVTKTYGSKNVGHQYTPGTGWQRISQKTGPVTVPWRFDRVMHYCTNFHKFQVYANTEYMTCSNYCIDNANCKAYRIKNGNCELSDVVCGDDKWTSSLATLVDNMYVTGTYRNLFLAGQNNGVTVSFKLAFTFSISLSIKVLLGSYVGGLGLGGPYITLSFGFEFVNTINPPSKYMYVNANYDSITKPTTVVAWNTVTLNADGTQVWAIDSVSRVWYRPGITNMNDATQWQDKTAGITLVQVAVSGDGNHVWGVNSAGKVFYRAGVSGTWQAVAASIAIQQVSVNTDGTQVWAVSGGKPYNRAGKGDIANAAQWTLVASTYNDLTLISVSGDGKKVWAASRGNAVRVRDVKGIWTDKSISAAAGKTVSSISVSADASLVCASVVDPKFPTYCRYGESAPWLSLSDSQYDPSVEGLQLGVTSKISYLAVSGDGNKLWAVSNGLMYQRAVGSTNRIALKRFKTWFDINFVFDISVGIKIKIEIELDLKLFKWTKTLFSADLIAFTLFSVKVPFYRLELVSDDRSRVISTKEYRLGDDAIPIAMTLPSPKDSLLMGTPAPNKPPPPKAPVLHHNAMESLGDLSSLFNISKPPAPTTAKEFLAAYSSVDAWTGSCDSDVFVYRVNMQYISKEQFVVGYDVSHGKSTCTLKSLYKAAKPVENKNQITLEVVNDKTFTKDTCWMQDIPTQLKIVQTENSGFKIYNRWSYCGDIALRKSSSLSMMKRKQSIMTEQSLAAYGTRLSVTADGNVEFALIDTDQILYESKTISPAWKDTKPLLAELEFDDHGSLVVRHSYSRNFSKPVLELTIGGHPDAYFVEMTECDVVMYGGSPDAPDRTKVLWSLTGRTDCRELMIDRDHPKWHKGGNVLYQGEILNENSGLYNGECVFEHEFGRAHMVRWSDLQTTWSTAANEKDVLGGTAVFTLLWNGNLALIDKQGQLRWESKTAGSGATHAVLEGCKLVLYKKVNGINSQVWSANGASSSSLSGGWLSSVISQQAFGFPIPELKAPARDSKLKMPHMEMGDYLLPGQSVLSLNAILTHQPDGNVVLYQRTSKGTTPLWSTKTAGQCTTAFAFTHDGNLGLYACPSNTKTTSSNPQIWSTGALDARPMMVGVGDDCTVKLYSQAIRGTFNPDSVIKAVSDTKCGKADKNLTSAMTIPAFREVYGSLPRGASLARGQATLTDSVGLVLQSDGDLVYYEYSPRSRIVWRSNTAGQCMSEFGLVDNNAILIDCNGVIAWRALKGTSSLLRGDLATVGSNITLGRGYVAIENAKGKVLWDSTKAANGADKSQGMSMNDNDGTTSSTQQDNTSSSSSSSTMSTAGVVGMCLAVGLLVVGVIVVAVIRRQTKESTSDAMLSP